MHKLQLFYVYKFQSNRLKEYKYNITITPDQARLNGELVSVGDSQALRTIREITKSTYSRHQLKLLEQEKQQIKLEKNNKSNRDKLNMIQNQIDLMLHIPEYISVVIDSKTHYKKMIKTGFFINKVKYVRLMCGAGHARKNTVIFCASHIEDELKRILKNGMKNIEIAHSKYNAYFALYSGSSYQVSSPRVCVLPDCIVKRVHKVDWVEEKSGDNSVEERELELEFNLWDGMGIISPKYAEQWAAEIGVTDYIPATFRITKSFIKGMVCVFDFCDFADKIAQGKTIINDVWGNPIKNINDYDMILTQSQFKLWKAYPDGWESYEKCCKENNIYWGISKVSPKQEKHMSELNYQYIQAINLDDNGIKALCEPTTQWINDILGRDVMKSILFMSGDSVGKAYSDNVFNISDIPNEIVSALILNNEIINDPYVKSTILRLIRKKITKASIGKLLTTGNYQVMISDPFCFCEYMFGMEIKGLLKDGEHYSNYWNQCNTSKVVAMRSPLTWRSEVNTLNLQINTDTEYWYKYLNSGIVYNVHGVDVMLAADSDYDYDIVMTTNNEQFINGCYGGLPITYAKNPTMSLMINEDDLYLSDIYSFNTKIGFVTNCSTSLYCMLAEYDEGSKEYDEIIKRLKICRKEQGSQIDRAKGLVVQEFPKNWICEQKIYESDSEEIKQQKIFMNSLVIKKKPMFMKYLYGIYNNKYKKLINNANTYCEVNFGGTFEEILNRQDKTLDELKHIDDFNKYLMLNDAPCIMNKLCRHMENAKFDFRKFVKDTNNFDYSILLDESHPINVDSVVYKEVYEIYRSFTDNKHLHMTISTTEYLDDADNKERTNEDNLESLQQVYEYYKNRLNSVCTNINLLANIAVDICYRKHPSCNKDFVWKLCSDGLLQNIKMHRQSDIRIPIKDVDGSLEYLGELYSIRGVEIL